MKPQRILVGVVAVGFVVAAAFAATRGDDGGDGATEAGDLLTTTSVRETTTTTQSTTTTTVAPAGPASGVIVAGTGVAGWSRDGEFFGRGDGEPPAVVGETYSLVRVGEPTTTAVGGAIEPACEFVSGSLLIADVMDYTWGPDTPLAIAADWDVVPHGVELLSTDSEVHRDIVSEVLEARGVTDPSPELRQVIRTDLEGDGVDEVIITAGHDGIFGAGMAPLVDGDYSIAILHTLVDGEVQTTVLDFFRHEHDPDVWSIYLVTHRITAIADLDGDGRMEIALNQRHYEGSYTTFFAASDGELAPIEELAVGCGV